MVKVQMEHGRDNSYYPNNEKMSSGNKYQITKETFKKENANCKKIKTRCCV